MVLVQVQDEGVHQLLDDGEEEVLQVQHDVELDQAGILVLQVEEVRNLQEDLDRELLLVVVHILGDLHNQGLVVVDSVVQEEGHQVEHRIQEEVDHLEEEVLTVVEVLLVRGEDLSLHYSCSLVFNQLNVLFVGICNILLIKSTYFA